MGVIGASRSMWFSMWTLTTMMTTICRPSWVGSLLSRLTLRRSRLTVPKDRIACVLGGTPSHVFQRRLWIKSPSTVSFCQLFYSRNHRPALDLSFGRKAISKSYRVTILFQRHIHGRHTPLRVV